MPNYILTHDLSYSGRFLFSKKIRYPRFFVYAWRRGEEYLYIGQTGSGWDKFKRKHRVIGKVETRLETDFIDIWICSDYKEINSLEKDLIKELKPKYNIIHHPINKRKTKGRINKDVIVPSELLVQCRNKEELKELKRKFTVN